MRFRILVLGVVGAIAPAHAEFVLVSAPPAEAADSAGTPSAASTSVKQTLRTHSRRLAPDPAVTGFGDHVPLSFAVRQIVPARFQVAFGEHVDREAPVDWKGGRPWRPTLSEALKPLGLKVAMSSAIVTIVGAASTP